MKKMKYLLCASLILLLLMIRCLALPVLQAKYQQTYNILPILWIRFGLTSIILVNELHLAYVLWSRNSEKKLQLFIDLIILIVTCIILYLIHKPKVFTDFLMIDVMEFLFLIELICAIFIDLKRKK